MARSRSGDVAPVPRQLADLSVEGWLALVDGLVALVNRLLLRATEGPDAALTSLGLWVAGVDGDPRV